LRKIHNGPAPNVSAIQAAFKSALKSPSLHFEKRRAPIAPRLARSDGCSRHC
jgi:hypothetical protein